MSDAEFKAKHEAEVLASEEALAAKRAAEAAPPVAPPAGMPVPDQAAQDAAAPIAQ